MPQRGGRIHKNPLWQHVRTVEARLQVRPGLSSSEKGPSQAAQPPPQMKKERVAAVALPRHSGHTLFNSFLGRGGEEEKDF